MKILKAIGIIFLILLFGIGGYIAYFINFHNDIELTQANVNEQALHELSLTNTSLTNVWGEKISIQKGTLIVPGNRSSKSSNHIAISFIKIPSANPSTRSPVFFLAGGPGTPTSSIAKRSYFYLFKKLSEQLDVVLIDQRGTGNSIPNLRCRNSLAMPDQIVENTQAAILEDVIKKCKECADEFNDMGIDLAGYSSEESAIDIDDIRKALQYDSISLLGYSYGTELAQHYVDMFEERVDKLIFAGTTAPDLGLKNPEMVEQQFYQMDSLIKADKKMRKYIPDFISLMQKQHAILKEHPLAVELPLMDAVGADDGFFGTNLFRLISIFKPNWKLSLTDTHLKTMMAQNTGTKAWTQIAPSYYYKLSNGEYKRLGNYLRNFRRQKMPSALFFTVSASTFYPQEHWDLVSQGRTKELISHFSLSFGRYPEVFNAFGVKPVPGLNKPVSSNKKLLLIAGTLDGRTPLANTDSVYQRFPNASKIIIKNGSHNSLIDAKTLPFIIQFLEGENLPDTLLHRSFEFVPPVPYKHAIADTLESIRTSSGIEQALEIYKAIRSQYLDQEDYFYDLSESSLNNYAYQLLSLDLFDDAVKVFQLNKDLFPNSDNVYNSLAEGLIAQGDTSSAIINLQKAVQLNYLDGNSHQLLRQLE